MQIVDVVRDLMAIRTWFTVGVLAAGAAGCGAPETGWWNTPTSPASPAPGTSAVTIVNVVVVPPVVESGGSARGTVTIDRDAPSEGTDVRLSSTDAAMRVPEAIRIPGGARTATFAVATSSVSQDATARVVATVGTVTGQATLDVWATGLPTSFTWLSDPADPIFRGAYGRATPANATFVARCEREWIMAMITTPLNNHFIRLAAPLGRPLRPGAYEGAERFNGPSVPAIDISVNSTGCNTTRGRFVVTEAELGANGQIGRFVATFEEFCAGSPVPIRGEVRLTGPFQLPPFQVSCFR
jgi:hypothetical protein